MLKNEEAENINHLAFIMDGNRRWAKQNGKSTIDGHKEGLRTLERILSPLFKKGISFISLYVFSLDNWNRDPKEIEALHKLIKSFRDRNIDRYKEEEIRVKVSGTKKNLSEEILQLLEKIQEETKSYEKGTLNLCFNYSGREEILEAAKLFAKDMSSDKIEIDKITKTDFKKYLYIPNIPDVDIMIRTSGEKRLSDFLPYQSSYAELFFTETLWPDLKLEEISDILASFTQRNRRFGR